jgi:hypothetical protein
VEDLLLHHSLFHWAGERKRADPQAAKDGFHGATIFFVLASETERTEDNRYPLPPSLWNPRLFFFSCRLPHRQEESGSLLHEMAWRRAGRPAADPARVICLTVDLGNVVYSMSAHIVVSPCIKEESVCLIWYISLIHSLYLLGASIFDSGNLLLSLNTRLSWKAVLGDAASASLHLPIYLSSDFI